MTEKDRVGETNKRTKKRVSRARLEPGRRRLDEQVLGKGVEAEGMQVNGKEDRFGETARLAQRSRLSHAVVTINVR